VNFFTVYASMLLLATRTSSRPGYEFSRSCEEHSFFLTAKTGAGYNSSHQHIAVQVPVPVSLNRDRASGPGGLSLNDGSLD